MEDINALTAQGNKHYAFGKWEEAADAYALALEKVDPTNNSAELLLLYGRTLVKVALQKSQVLGNVPNERPLEDHQETTETTTPDPRFSFQGDDAPEGEEETDRNEGDYEDEEETSAEDDFQNAWETLDLARVSFQKQLDEVNQDTDKKLVKKRLAETCELLGEVSLENENFDQAVEDLKTALLLKQELHESSSSHVSGAHYMLALALEYCTSESSRQEAASEVGHAIASFEERLKTIDKNDKSYKDESDMLAELRLKLSELQAPREEIKADVVKDLLGGQETVLKESLVKAMQSSNDLSTLVRKKDKKRSAELKPQETEVDAKKLKVEDPASG